MRDGAFDASFGDTTPGQGLSELARSLLAEPDFLPVGATAGVIPDHAAPAAARALLSLEDLLTDDSGACVFGADGPNVSIVVQTDQPVIAEGAADAFANAAGSDVSGHAFIAFASGITLYFPAELDVSLMPTTG